MINIIYLGYSRIRYFDYLKRVFAKMRNKTNVRILLLLPEINEWWASQKTELTRMGFHVVLERINHGGNYRAKLFRSFDFPSQYTIKIDEDIFCTASTLDYMIDNASVAITDKCFILTPLLSSGIPTSDRFISNNLTSDDASIINQSFMKIKFGHMWGSDYSALNKHTVECSHGMWDPTEFLKTVSTLQTCFKGIHPVRLSAEAQTILHHCVMKNISKMSNTNFSISNLEYPYICNSFFMIKTEVWRSILSDASKWVDLYDEVPLNLFMKQHNKSMAIIDGSFVVHPSYNTIGEVYSKISDEFHSFIMGQSIS